MTHSPYPVVLDACVLYPSLLRDLLIYLGLTGLCQPKWSLIIEDEWLRNLVADRPDLKPEQIKPVNEYRDALLRQDLPQTVKELSKYHALI